ncbi:MAG: hypothetical protein ACO37C_04685 [Gemmobacter sp.]|jgi:hypothetical protein
MNPYLAAGAILLAILGAAGGGVALWQNWPASGPPAPIEAEVTLRNTCPVGDEVFVVHAPQSGRWARFNNGVAKIMALPGEPLRLRIAPGFDDVTYAGYDEPAARKVELVADCGSSERQQMINRAMRDTFRN